MDIAQELHDQVGQDVQEALTNVARHSGWSHADLGLRSRDAGGLMMTVSDDGGGLPTCLVSLRVAPHRKARAAA